MTKAKKNENEAVQEVCKCAEAENAASWNVPVYNR